MSRVAEIGDELQRQLTPISEPRDQFRCNLRERFSDDRVGRPTGLGTDIFSEALG